MTRRTPEALQPPTDKAAFLRAMAPLFPDMCEFADRLQAIESTRLAADDWGGAMARHYEVAEGILFPLWKRLAPAFSAALAAPFHGDPGTLETCVEDWPVSVAAQQSSLHQLLAESKLRQAWRGYCGWLSTQRALYTDGQRRVLAEIEREMREANAPLREIPLYHAIYRDSCLQLVCMPVAMWRCLCANEKYEPQRIDPRTVDRLSWRVAQVFNAPPVTDESLWAESPSWREAIVWGQSAEGLTTPIECHGIRDRLEDVGGRPAGVPVKTEPATCPEWRYEGFCGQVRVTLESGEDWSVTVLAPLHFLRHLVRRVTQPGCSDPPQRS